MRVESRQAEIADPLDALAALPDADSAIDAWLSVVSRLMHLPEKTRRDICNELREHLRERVRDLLLGGSDERAAVRTAIEELGETAQLARRFEAADRPRGRRLLMHATLMLATGGAIAAAIMTFSPNHGESRNAARFGESTVVAEPPKSLTNARITLPDGTTLRDAVQSAAKQADVGLLVDWGSLEEAGIDLSSPLGLSFKDVPGPRALTLVAQTVGERMTALDWRAREGNLIEFGLQHDLDAHEIELVSYDITATINILAGTFTDSKEKAAEQITGLLTELVTPDYWRQNGGDLAQLQLVGGRLFVEAPSRTHTKVKWILDQLPVMPGGEAKADAQVEDVPLLKDLPILGDQFKNEGVRRVLNPGDRLTVSIFELYQPNTWHTTTRQIDEIGMYRVSELGEVRAAGMTRDQFQAAVAGQLKDKVMKVEPKVDVVFEGAGR
ncbi:MAG TPA: polysaccharide biosynthesis/export family protein [Phycisphaerales bacterium]|nr:polysaccharide biosynthesis/export family protein [Phycisphaerales bacterium]